MALWQAPTSSLKPPHPVSPTPTSNVNLHLNQTLQTKVLQGGVSQRNRACTVNSSRVHCSSSSRSRQLQCSGLKLMTLGFLNDR